MKDLTVYLEHIRKMDAMEQELRFPQLPTGVTWFNSPPLTLESLRDKIIVVDFWTYCCINCLHTLPHLKKLEEKYRGKPVVFLGVHSAKFSNEKNDEQLKKAIERYDIHHPVVNDHEMKLWRSLGVRAWPTLMVIGPHGQCLFSTSGEGKTQEIDLVIEAALKHYGLKDTPAVENPVLAPSSSNLRFPSKIAICDKHKRLFIADSGHHRILICNLDGKVEEVIGAGEQGFENGSFHKARFHAPQGLAIDNGLLYIADTENHALRCADLDKKSVHTLVGSGQQGYDYKGGKQGTKQSLSSPWDLVIAAGQLFIAMAGTHQIWVYDFATHIAKNFSGTGQELHLNSDSAFSAAWAQPSGLSFGQAHLFIADSESSSIRALSLKTGQSLTLAGGDPENPYNLFAFGDGEGKAAVACLQHPLAVLWIESSQELIVADTYNHRIKKLDPKSGILRNWIGSGQSGNRDGNAETAQFSEPSGLAVSPEKNLLYVADTNNHAIRVVDMTKSTVSTLLIKDIPL